MIELLYFCGMKLSLEDKLKRGFLLLCGVLFALPTYFLWKEVLVDLFRPTVEDGVGETDQGERRHHEEAKPPVEVVGPLVADKDLFPQEVGRQGKQDSAKEEKAAF